MKSTGICPKCDSREIKVGKRGGYSAIQSLGLWFLGAATDAHVCKGCGYVEEYIVNRSLEKIRRNR